MSTKHNAQQRRKYNYRKAVEAKELALETLDAQKEAFSEVIAERDDLKAEIERLKKACNASERSYSEREIEPRVAALQERLSAKQAECETKQIEIDRLTVELETARKQVEDLKAKLADGVEVVEDPKTELADKLGVSLEASVDETGFMDSSRLYQPDEAENEPEPVKESNGTQADVDVDALVEENEVLREQLRASEEMYNNLKAELEAARTEASSKPETTASDATLMAQVKSLQMDNSSLSAQLQRARQDATEALKEADDLKAELDETNSDYNDLISLSLPRPFTKKPGADEETLIEFGEQVTDTTRKAAFGKPYVVDVDEMIYHKDGQVELRNFKENKYMFVKGFNWKKQISDDE